jgi:hypothetical protein
MAVTEITPITVTKDTIFNVVGTTGVAINAANEMEIPYPKEGRLMIVILSAHNDTNATFKAGFGVAAGLGTLATGTIANAAARGIIVSSDRLKVGKGLGTNAIRGVLEISWATNSAGYLAAYYLP